MTIREARIIAPCGLGTGNLADNLIRAFGGLTQSRAKGFWRNPQSKVIGEDVWIFDVAAEDTTDNNSALLAIAARYKLDADQLSIAKS